MKMYHISNWKTILNICKYVINMSIDNIQTVTASVLRLVSGGID